MRLPESHIGVLTSVLAGPILFCVCNRFTSGVELQPCLGIHQGDPMSPQLFKVVTFLFIYDFQRLKTEIRVLFLRG